MDKDFLAFMTEEDSPFEIDFSIFDGEKKEDVSEKEADDPDEIGILPLKKNVLFPGVVMPITVHRERSIQLVKEVNRTKHKRLGVLTQVNNEKEDPTGEDLHQCGTVARILKLFKMPDGSITLILQGGSRFIVKEYTQEEPFLRAKIVKPEEQKLSEKQIKALIRNLRKEASRVIDLSNNLPQEAKIAIENIEKLPNLTHFIASNLNVDYKQKQQILAQNDLKLKAEKVLQHLESELDILELSAEIQSKVREDMDKQQRDYMLRQQIRTIQEELGEVVFESEIEELKAKAAHKKWTKETQQAFQKEISKLARLNPSMPDYANIINYLDWLIELPWNEFSTDVFDFKKTQKILDDDHAGLEKVKERVLEFLAVLKLKKDKKAPILCFVGPPGVGKTSLGKSIATALGREYVRMSLGGVRDEAEIRGHRRTYIGSMPGRVLQSMKKAKTSNPVFVLDEIDKVGNDFRGDPSSALLEVLDPEQNNTFADHFLEVPYDLSNVMFIATANSYYSIHPALRDRMEFIEMSGYSLEEKMEIAKKHLLPEAILEHGLTKKDLKVNDKALQKVIQGYTRESGVRRLSQKLAALCRAVAKKIVMQEEEQRETIKVTEKNLSDFLGATTFEGDTYKKLDVCGVAVGLAWTQVGGEVLFLESTLLKGTGNLHTTGQLGGVMKESADLAHILVKVNAEKLGIDAMMLEKWNIHLHIPEGAIPKDGPSAGITFFTVLASLLSRRKVKPNLAMTGEVTLHGKVLPVGGIREKVLAAVRSGITTLIMCKANEKDVKEIKGTYLEKITFHYVENIMQVANLVLEKEVIAGDDVLMQLEKWKAEAKSKVEGNA
ncbi:MAG: endopeptidase La [Bacteroidia bacterium]